MSTRCHVVVIDDFTDPGKCVMFYRHSDGYREGVEPTLNRFCELVNEGVLRDNAEQSAGWLVLLGAQEYEPYRRMSGLSVSENDGVFQPPTLEEMLKNPATWKVGSYEPCCDWHGDIEYIHVVDLRTTGKAYFETYSAPERIWDMSHEKLSERCADIIAEHMES